MLTRSHDYSSTGPNDIYLVYSVVGKHDTLPIISQLNAQAQAQAHAHANANAAGAIKDGEMCPQEVFFKVLIICFDPAKRKIAPDVIEEEVGHCSLSFFTSVLCFLFSTSILYSRHLESDDAISSLDSWIHMCAILCIDY